MKYEQLIREISSQYLEKIFDASKHQDVIHELTTGAVWDYFLSDVSDHLRAFKLERRSQKFVTTYVAERTRMYAETYLSHLHERVGTVAMIDAGLVKDPEVDL